VNLTLIKHNAYDINNEKRDDHKMVKVILYEQIDTLKEILDENLTIRICSKQANKFDSYNQFNLITFDWYEVEDKKSKPVQIAIYLSKEDLIFICEEEETQMKILKIVSKKASNEKLLYMFFSELLADDIMYLEELEEQITETEDELLQTTKTLYTNVIITYRRELLRLKRYYEQLNRIFDGLTDNESSIISTSDLHYFKILNNKIDRLLSHILNLRDYVSQLREAYQAQIDIEQNKLMKIFTVVSSIFMPLTLIVGWYGMNMRMPEYSWNYGYVFVITLCTVVTILCIRFFKNKKWL